jgi:hypothetical protein
MNSEGTALSSASPEAVRLFAALLELVGTLGPYQEEPKKTSVHLTNKSAFMGVHFRRRYLILTLKAESPIDSPRVVKTEQVSKNRWHCVVKLAEESAMDDALRVWIRAAYQLCA